MILMQDPLNNLTFEQLWVAECFRLNKTLLLLLLFLVVMVDLNLLYQLCAEHPYLMSWTETPFVIQALRYCQGITHEGRLLQQRVCSW